MLHRLYQIMKIATEFIYEKWLDDLIIEQDAFWESVMLSRNMISIWNRKVVLESLEHLFILKLESAHNILTSQEQVHQACHQNPLGVFLALIIDRDYINKVHE